VRCPACGEENPDRARFCIVCGTPLESGPPPDEQRKVVTILFCDLAGLPEPETTDPEDVRAALQPYLLRIKRDVEAKGGTLEKFLGEGALGVFGAPVVHEDDPERAVRAALAVVDSLDQLQAEVVRPLRPRIGIETGEAVVALGAGPQIGESLTGDVVNTASRILSVADEGTIAVGERTHEATRAVFDYQELAPVTVKGKRDALALWRPTGTRSRFGIGVEARDHPATPFVGRGDESAFLTTVFRRAVRTGSVQLVTVTGEPGIGKSRLIGEFKAVLEPQPDPVRWRQGRCLPYGEGVTFWALGEIVKAEAGILESDPPQLASEKLHAAIEPLVDDPPERAWLHSRLAPLIGVGATAPADRTESFAAWRRFLEAMASQFPLILVVEDLHWADPPLLEFLEHLMTAASVPMLLVVASRLDLFVDHPTWGGGQANSLTITLPPLSDHDTASLIASLLDRVLLPAETQAALIERAGGNPLYAEEFVRMLTDHGLIDARGGLPTDLSTTAFPQTVQALIAARLDALSPRQKAILQNASVVGKVFWAGAIADLSGESAWNVTALLDELAAKELIRGIRISSVDGEREYQFWHGLIGDVAYGQIPRAIRADRHRRAAAWLERLAGDRIADHAEVLAFHLGRAWELAPPGDDTGEGGELRTSLCRYLLLAAERALSLDVAKAQTHLESAIERSHPDDPLRPDLVRALADAEFLAGRLDASQRLFEEAIERLQAAGRALDAAAASVGLFRVLQYRGETARARDLLGRTTNVLATSPPGAAYAQALAEAAGAMMTSGHFEDAIAASGRAIDVARAVGAREQEIRAIGFRGYARVGLGDRSGLDEERESLERGLALGLGRSTAVAYNNVANDLRMIEGPSASLGAFSEGIAFADDRGLVEMAAWMRMTMLLPLIDLGRWDDAVAGADRVIAASRSSGAGYDQAFAEALRVYVLAQREGAGAAESAASALAKAREVGDPQVLVGALAASSIVELAVGRPRSAAGLVEEALAATEQAGRDARVWYLPDLVRTAIAAGDVHLARRCAAGIRTTLPRYRLAVLATSAALLEAEGEPDDASARYRGVAARWESYGHRLEYGFALLGWSRCLSAVGREDEARLPAATARDLFTEIGARAALAAADPVGTDVTALSS
jgi:class 3 adenylate cyclase/tetratricopeptide (TPR) repeat protein